MGIRKVRGNFPRAKDSDTIHQSPCSTIFYRLGSVEIYVFFFPGPGVIGLSGLFLCIFFRLNGLREKKEKLVNHFLGFARLPRKSSIDLSSGGIKDWVEFVKLGDGDDSLIDGVLLTAKLPRRASFLRGRQNEREKNWEGGGR